MKKQQIEVTVALKAHLMWYSKDKKKVYNLALPEDTRISDLVTELELSPELIRAVFCNGQQTSWDKSLTDGDEIEFLPITAGG